MTRFTLRDLFWLALVVGLSVGWWVDRAKLVPYRDREQVMHETLRDADSQFTRIMADLKAKGVIVDYSRGGVFLPGDTKPRWPGLPPAE
jgi:hypothetical protein